MIKPEEKPKHVEELMAEKPCNVQMNQMANYNTNEKSPTPVHL